MDSDTVIGTLSVDWCVGCYISYSKEWHGRAVRLLTPLSLLLVVLYVTANPSTASGPTSYYSMCHYKYLWPLKDQTKRSLLRKEAGRLLFDFGVIPQLLSTERTTIVNNRLRRSQSVCDSWKHLRCDDGRSLLTTVVVWRDAKSHRRSC